MYIYVCNIYLENTTLLSTPPQKLHIPEPSNQQIKLDLAIVTVLLLLGTANLILTATKRCNA